MLSIEVITELKILESIKKNWNELLLKSNNPAPYLTYQWFKTAWECLDNDKELHIIIVKDEKEIIAIAPLLLTRVQRFGIAINRLCFIRNANTPFQDFILTDRKEGSLALIINYLKENTHLWNILELDELRIESETVDLLKNVCSSKNLFYFDNFKHNSWYLPLESTWEEGLAKLKSKTRKEFKRKLNRLERLGALRLDIITDLNQINKHLKTFFEFHKKTWKGREKNSGFYYRIAKLFSGEQNLILYALHLNNKPIAYLYCIKMGTILYGLKTTYDPSYYAYSPGVVLFYKSIKSMYCQKNIKEFDIGRGEEQFKKDWSTFSHKQIISYVGNRGLKNTIYFIFRFIILPYCRREFFCKYLIPMFKKPLYYLIEINDGIKNYGLFKYLKDSIESIKQIIFNKIIVDFFKLNISADEKNLMESGDLFYKYADSDDIDRLAVAMNARNLKQIKQRFGKKDKCLIVYNNDEILYYFWFAYDEIFLNEINESIILKNDQVFLYNHNAIANTKLKNIFSIICKKLTEDDVKEILTAICLNENDNGNLFYELGFRKNKRIVKRKLFKKLI